MKRPLAGILKLVWAYPLHLIAAFLAALISDALLTVQPLFLGAFIDQAQAGLPLAKLWVFPAMMAAAALLAYAYDLISVAIRYFLQRRVSQHLEETYLDFCAGEHPESLQFSLRGGISNVAQLSLSLSVDVLLTLARVLLILACLSLDQARLGILTSAAVAAGVLAAVATTSRIGRISKMMEMSRQRILSRAQAGRPRAAGGLERLYRFDQAQFGLKSANVLVSFCLFRLLPLSVLVWYLFGSGLSLGALASTFLYFSMLRGPYGDLIQLLQDSLVSFAQSSLILSDLERGLALRRIFDRVPIGLVWSTMAAKAGAPLSGLATDAERGREYFDDLAASGDAAPSFAERKKELLLRLAARSRGASVCLHSDDPAVAGYAHFVLSENGRLGTVLEARA